MKKYYDKVLFLLALVVLGLGAGIFFKNGGVPKTPPQPVATLTGGDFSVIPAPKFDKTTYSWSAPADQQPEPGWIYYVFTPPKIWWDPNQGWIVRPPGKQPPPAPFGVHLVSAKKILYRIQLLDSIGSRDKDATLIFYDEDSDWPFYLKDGEESSLYKIKVTDVSFGPLNKGNGVVVTVATATILDEKTNETVTLTAGVDYSPTDNEVYILHTDDPFPPQDWKVAKDDYQTDSLTFPGSLEDFKDNIIFTVVALDFSKPSVTVKKQWTTKAGRLSSTERELMIEQTPMGAPAPGSSTPPPPDSSVPPPPDSSIPPPPAS